MEKNKGILFLTILLLVYSCRSVHTISVLECTPPPYPIPNKIQNVALLNRSMTHDFVNLSFDSISVEKRMGNNNLNFTRNFCDSIAADSAIVAAAKSLYQSLRFDVIVPINRNILRKNEKDGRKPLDSAFIKEMCQNYNVDGILVLENFEQRVARRIKSSMNIRYYGIIRVNSQSRWKFYAPELKTLELPIENISSWNSYLYYSLNNLYKNLPKIKEALTGGATELGMRVGEQFIPEWQKGSKYYYKTGKKKIDAAISLIYDDKWTEASEIWTRYDSVSSKTLRSKIEFNLAVCADVNGNLDQAIEWASKSLKSKYYRRTELYLKQLNLNKSKKAIFEYNIASAEDER